MQGSDSHSPGQEADDDPQRYSNSEPDNADEELRAAALSSESPPPTRLGGEPFSPRGTTRNHSPQTQSRPASDPSMLQFHGFLALCAVTRPTHGPPLTLQTMLRQLEPVLEPFIPSEYWPTFEALFLSSMPSQAAQTYIDIMNAVNGLARRLEEQEERPRHIDQNEPKWWPSGQP